MKSYRNIGIPNDKDPREYSYVQRRADILRLIEEHGHPRAYTQRELSERYGVSQQQISKDMKRIKAYIRETLGDDIKVYGDLVFRKALRHYVEQDDYMKAIDIVERWTEWLFKVGALPRQPEKVHVEAEGDISYTDEAMEQAIKELREEARQEEDEKESDNDNGSAVTVEPVVEPAP